MNRKTILDNQEAREFLKQFKVTNVVAGRGHDCGGLVCFLKLKSKTLVDYHDDGWGGQPEIRFDDDDARQLLYKKLTDFNYAQKMFDNGWDFMKSPDEIDLDTQVEDVISALVNLKNEVSLMRKTKRAFIFGNHFSQSEVAWSKRNLADIPSPLLQRTYDKYKKELVDGQRFFNTKEQLISLGINP
mgnify:CR=1 FL=1|tara:strand:+ start:5267 stop:5824 length:558 start_codon:yes stop_codon:yes gene_type:complete